MLDLPKPDQIRLSTMDNIGPTGVVGGGLERKGSLTRRITSNTQSPLATLPSSSSSPSTTTTTTGNTFPSTAQPPSTTNTTGNTSDSLPLPSLGFSVPSAAGAASPYTPPATSYGTTLKGSGSASPNQSKSGNNAINYTSNSMIDGTTGRPALGIDEYGIRFRQGTNMSNNTAMTSSSDYSFSNTSIAFGTLNQNDNNSSIIRGVGGFIDNGFGNLGLNDQQQLIGRNDNAQPPPIFGNNSGAFNSLPPRRDSGYAHSLYNNNNNNNHNNPSPSIGFGNFGPAGNEGRRGSRSTVSILSMFPAFCLL